MSDKTEKWEADDCRVFMGDGGISLHNVPNGVDRARLIAAAPDLLAALISTRASLQAMADEGIVAEGSWPTIDAAIAKAYGS